MIAQAVYRSVLNKMLVAVLRKYPLLFTITVTNALAYVLLLTVGEWKQESFVPLAARREASLHAALGMPAPRSLLSCLRTLPAIAIVFPSCMECFVDSPSLLKGQAFHRKVEVIFPGISVGDLEAIGNLGPGLETRGTSSQLSEILDISAAPKVVEVSADGRLVYVQPGYIPAKRLPEVVNGL